MRGTDDPLLYREANDRLSSMLRRCYDKEDPAYKFWGATGATVCDEWHDPDVFCSWYIKNKIGGWDIEKDIIQLKSGGMLKQYSPENCCFVPKYLNQWFAITRSVPVIRRNSKWFYGFLYVKRYDGKKQFRLSGDTEDDVMEQYFLAKDLHLEKIASRMKQEWNDIKAENPKTPEINPMLLSVLENFSTEEYLAKKNFC